MSAGGLEPSAGLIDEPQAIKTYIGKRLRGSTRPSSNFIIALLSVESDIIHRANGNVIGGKDGEVGIGQIVPDDWNTNFILTNLEDNIEASIFYIQKMGDV